MKLRKLQLSLKCLFSLLTFCSLLIAVVKLESDHRALRTHDALHVEKAKHFKLLWICNRRDTKENKMRDLLQCIPLGTAQEQVRAIAGPETVFSIQGWWAEISYESGLTVLYDGNGRVQSLDVTDFEVGENEESPWKDITDRWPMSRRSVSPRAFERPRKL